MVRQIGMALKSRLKVLVMHFQSSYSAARVPPHGEVLPGPARAARQNFVSRATSSGWPMKWRRPHRSARLFANDDMVRAARSRAACGLATAPEPSTPVKKWPPLKSARRLWASARWSRKASCTTALTGKPNTASASLKSVRGSKTALPTPRRTPDPAADPQRGPQRRPQQRPVVQSCPMFCSPKFLRFNHHELIELLQSPRPSSPESLREIRGVYATHPGVKDRPSLVWKPGLAARSTTGPPAPTPARRRRRHHRCGRHPRPQGQPVHRRIGRHLGPAIVKQLQTAAADTRVKSVLQIIDSPGGNVLRCPSGAPPCGPWPMSSPSCPCPTAS